MKKVLLFVPFLFCYAHSMQQSCATFASEIETTFKPLADGIVVKDGQFFQLKERVSSATGTPVSEEPVALPIYTDATSKALIKVIEEQGRQIAALRSETRNGLITLYRNFPFLAFPSKPEKPVVLGLNARHPGFPRDGWLSVDVKRNKEKESSTDFFSLRYYDDSGSSVELLSVRGASIKTFVPLTAKTSFSWDGVGVTCNLWFYESGNAYVLDGLKAGKSLQEITDEITTNLPE